MYKDPSEHSRREAAGGDGDCDSLLARAREWLNDGAVLIDVRTRDEFDRGHARGARNIPVHELPQRVDEIPSGARVVLYCHSGGRSAWAAAFLAQDGYEVIDLGSLHRGMQAAAADDPV